MRFKENYFCPSHRETKYIHIMLEEPFIFKNFTNLKSFKKLFRLLDKTSYGGSSFLDFYLYLHKNRHLAASITGCQAIEECIGAVLNFWPYIKLPGVIEIVVGPKFKSDEPKLTSSVGFFGLFRERFGPDSSRGQISTLFFEVVCQVTNLWLDESEPLDGLLVSDNT